MGARMNLASAHEQDGRAELAAAELEHVLRIENGNPEAEQRLAELRPG